MAVRPSDIQNRIREALQKEKEVPERDVDIEKELVTAVGNAVSALFAIDEVIRQYNVGLHRSQSNMDGKISVRFYAKPSKGYRCRRPFACQWMSATKGAVVVNQVNAATQAPDGGRTGNEPAARKGRLVPRETRSQIGLAEMRVKSHVRGAPALENDEVTERLLRQVEELLELRRRTVSELKVVLRSSRRLMKQINERLVLSERRLPKILDRLDHDWMDPEKALAAVNQKVAVRKEQMRYQMRRNQSKRG
ncbi:hypothetical protein KDW40_01915 [Burkholderia cenocepacia]|uniref:hypothetical protein n=1 Tax=Burkholderia cenocepacia TaxID=95486 RepID=UPI001B9B5052|nr:hypothetical protein [Burkholderia cenocepacia]MBR8043144.1 hypothetical protein [Burkholderia cenocepacia]MBR8324486.1 hypothetical protein [Burkholderia cenocepacia]